MSENEEYAANTRFCEPQPPQCTAHCAMRNPTLHGSLMAHHAVASGQQMHNMHALQINSVTLWQHLDFEEEEEEEEEEEGQKQQEEDVEDFFSML
ncbi:ENTH/ANTH/VHS superfamily protein [Actinidia rufa]|uniref:ENTH/ANTH/VHS superfamily protein n=1 Tax=Actinidia rufa TaxID=165716 RepID=A0A7J0DCI2_9ERIC|nr:ENTH/ANTH/VHS superfamily protein [Actinidia rufa]